MKKTKKKFNICIYVTVLMLLVLSACSSEPSVYNAPKGAAYEGLYEVDRMNSSSHYSYNKGVDEYVVTMDWKTKDENIDHAEFTDEYYLEWSFDEVGPSELCKPIKDMSALKSKTYTIKPGEKLEIQFDIDTYFDELYEGYYKFVKILKVVNKDGSTKDVVASFALDLSNDFDD